MEPGPEDSRYWPNAADFGAVWDGTEWQVYGIPPEPWPYVSYDDTAVVGPPGTVWQVPVSDYLTRVGHVPVDWVDTAVKRILKAFKFVIDLPPGELTFYWHRPEEVAMSVDLWRVTVHAKLGTVEETCNVMHFMPGDADTAEFGNNETGALAVAAAVRDAWTSFLGANLGMVNGMGKISGIYPNWCQFDEVRAAKVRMNGYPAHGNAAGTVDYLVDTAYVPFNGIGGTTPGAVYAGDGFGSAAAQTACVVSLGTGTRGKSKRGRVYLGPIVAGAFVDQGLFDPVMPQRVADAFHDVYMAQLAALAPSSLVLAVGSPRLGIATPVNQIRVGRVPDSQRRRRRSQAEQYVTG